MNQTQNIDNQNKELEEENYNLIYHFNSELKTIIQWVETYLGVYFNSENNIVELPNTISQLIKKRVKIDQLKESLCHTQKKIHEEYYRWDLQVKELYEENESLNMRLDKINLENLDLKNQLFDKQNENITIKEEIEYYSKKLSQKDKNFDSLNEKISNEGEKESKFYCKFVVKIEEIFKFIIDSNKNYDNLYPLDDINNCSVLILPKIERRNF